MKSNCENRVIRRRSARGRLAEELGVTTKFLNHHRTENGAPQSAFESADSFLKWLMEFNAGKPARRREAFAKKRKPEGVKKANREKWSKQYRAMPEVRARHNARMRARKDVNRARYYADPQFRIAVCLRSRTRKVLIGKIKSGATMQMVGCTGAELKAWLEGQFKPGMTWENYGHGWHIDHKRPLASFDLTQDAEQRLAFHFTNLQPLWALENKSKGDKLEWQKN